MSHSQQGMGGHSKDLSFFLFHYHHHHPATLPLCRSTGSMRADRRVCSLLSARIFHDYRQRSQNSTIFFWALYLCNCDICLLYSMGFGSTNFSHFVWLWVKRIDRNRRTGVLVCNAPESFSLSNNPSLSHKISNEDEDALGIVQRRVDYVFVYSGRHNLRRTLAASSTKNYFLIARMLRFLWHSRQKCRI